MSRMKSINNSMKYTIVIPNDDIEQLKKLADKKIISSVNAGVREVMRDGRRYSSHK